MADESHGGAFHFDGGGVEFGAEESPVRGVVNEDACTYPTINDGHLRWSREARGVHALWQFRVLFFGLNVMDRHNDFVKFNY